MGISPPARKVAVSPDSAVRLGLASVETCPSVSPRSIAPSRSMPSTRPPRPRVVRSGPWLKPYWVPIVVPAALVRSVIVPALRPDPTPKTKPLELRSRFSRLTPIDLTKLRLTSAMRTWRLTCNGVAVFRRLMTLVSLPTKAWTSRSASATSSGAATVPVSRIRPFIGVAAICASGMASRSIRPIESKLLPTRTVVA